MCNFCGIWNLRHISHWVSSELSPHPSWPVQRTLKPEQKRNFVSVKKQNKKQAKFFFKYYSCTSTSSVAALKRAVFSSLFFSIFSFTRLFRLVTSITTIKNGIAKRVFRYAGSIVAFKTVAGAFWNGKTVVPSHYIICQKATAAYSSITFAIFNLTSSFVWSIGTMLNSIANKHARYAVSTARKRAGRTRTPKTIGFVWSILTISMSVTS